MGAAAGRTALVLVNHPNLDILFLPVILELFGRGFHVETLVCEYGRTERLAAAGIRCTQDLNDCLGRFLTGQGDRIFLNGADLVPVHALGMQIDRLCRKQEIPTLTLEHGPFSVSRNEFGDDVLFEADRMALIGEYDRKMYIQAGVPPERLVVTGCPQYDAYQEAAAADRHRFGEGSILIAGQNHSFLGGGPFTFDRDRWRDLLGRMFQVLGRSFPGRPLVVKPHPAEPYFGCHTLYAEAAEAAARPQVRVVDPGEPVPELVLASDLVVSFSSSLLLESSLLGRRCFFLDPQGWKSRCVRDLERFGAVDVPAGPERFPEQLAESLAMEKGCAAWKVELDEATLARYVHRFDGRSAARVADACEALLAEPCLRTLEQERAEAIPPRGAA